MSNQRPTYISILDVIVSAESCGRESFEGWARLTPDPALRETLEVIAGKEREHAFSVARQIRRLGFEPEAVDVPGMAEFRDLLCSSTKPDVEKLRFFCPPGGGDPFPLEQIEHHPDYDPQSQALMSRYVAEERDTFRLLREELERLETTHR